MTKTVLSPSECAADGDETNIFQDKSEFQYLNKSKYIIFKSESEYIDLIKWWRCHCSMPGLPGPMGSTELRPLLYLVRHGYLIDNKYDGFL